MISSKLCRLRALARAARTIHGHVCDFSRTINVKTVVLGSKLPHLQFSRPVASIHNASQHQATVLMQHRCLRTEACASTLLIEVDVCEEGELRYHSRDDVEALSSSIRQDAELVVQAAIALFAPNQDPHELSIVLCDDDYIQELNREWRQKDSPTDVLSFPMGDDAPPGYPSRMLGDLVISLDTAARQAEELRSIGHTLMTMPEPLRLARHAAVQHSLLQECRVLLVHGVLHLLGYDHELGPQEAEVMSAAESAVMQRLGWQVDGLIESAGSGGRHQHPDSGQAAAAAETKPEAKQQRRRPSSTSGIRLLACDMDGTLLNTSSRVLPSTVSALKAAMKRGVTVMLATGKARPAAIAAMQSVGLAGEGLVVSTSGPGVFLQGLAVHDLDGTPLASPNLPPAVVEAAFQYAIEHNLPLSAFMGDVCATLRMHPELEELHTRYYEPLSQVLPSLNDLLAGPPVKKLLFMTEPDVVEGKLKPHWEAHLVGSGAQTTQAVETMLEVVPEGMHKWVGMDVLLRAMQLDASQVMTIGDGSNDLQLVANAGIGVCMANGVDMVKDAATFVTANNDDDGVALAIERFLL